MRRYVIVGSGAAGLAAAEAARRHDASAEISLFAEEPHGFYSRPGLAYLLTGTAPEKQLFSRSQAELRELCLNWVRVPVARLYPESHQVILADSQHLAYDRLLLATGSTAIKPDFPGGDLAGVVKLDNLDDARHILKLARRGRAAVVVGGGITALEMVEGLNARGVRVHYFLRGDRYWSNVLDETESGIVQDRLKAHGVIIHDHTQIKQAVGQHGTLAGVETVAGDTVPCHILGIAIGVRPRMEIAQQAHLQVERGIAVDEFMQTSAPDVFAAGDVAQGYDPRSKRSTLDTLWSTALAQGQVAGCNMAGVQTGYVKGVSFNVTRLAGLTTTLIGAMGSGRDQDLLTIARGDSETWHTRPDAWVIAEQHEVNRLRLLVDERAIVGALVMGDQTLSRPLQDLIEHQVDIESIREAIKADPAAVASLILDLHRQWEQSRRRPQAAETALRV